VVVVGMMIMIMIVCRHVHHGLDDYEMIRDARGLPPLAHDRVFPLRQAKGQDALLARMEEMEQEREKLVQDAAAKDDAIEALRKEIEAYEGELQRLAGEKREAEEAVGRHYTIVDFVDGS
jgi:hypothetical protein